MKKALVFFMSIWFLSTSFAQYKKDGTPDMRYSSNKQNYGNTYSSTPSYSTPNYSTSTQGSGATSSDVRYQNGYSNSSVKLFIQYQPTQNNSNNGIYVSVK